MTGFDPERIFGGRLEYASGDADGRNQGYRNDRYARPKEPGSRRTVNEEATAQAPGSRVERLTSDERYDDHSELRHGDNGKRDALRRQ